MRGQSFEAVNRVALSVRQEVKTASEAETLLPYLSSRRPPAVRVEVATALRFPLSRGASRKAVRSSWSSSRYYVGFHFAERPVPESRGVGAELLESPALKAPRSRLGKAAKNKLALLQL